LILYEQDTESKATSSLQLMAHGRTLRRSETALTAYTPAACHARHPPTLNKYKAARGTVRARGGLSGGLPADDEVLAVLLPAPAFALCCLLLAAVIV
jgi:hypothetical protein